MGTKKKVADLARSLAKRAGEHMGDVVWADLELGERLFRREEIRDVLLEYGLPADIQESDVSADFAFGRAVARLDLGGAFSMEREAKRSARVLLLRKEGQGLARKIDPVAVLAADESDPRGFVVEWNAALHDEAADAAIAGLTSAVSRYRSFIDGPELASTIRSALLEWFGGVRLSRHGGVYFIPHESAGELRAFTAVVKRIGGSDLPFLPIHDTEEAREQGGALIGRALDGEIADVVSELRDFAMKAGTRSATWESRVSTLDELRGRVDVLAHVLGSREGSLRKAIADAESAITRALAGDLSWAKEPAKEADPFDGVDAA